MAAAVVATVLIVNNQSNSPHEAVPTANEIALQSPQDSGPAPFTPSVETQAVSAPAPTQQPTKSGGATTPAVLHSVEGGSAGLYGGTMSKPACDTERLIAMVSPGDTGRAWASAAGIAQADIPGYLRSLTSAYLRVDTRVTNHNYKTGAVVEYQSALQAGTSVLVDAQGVPRVRCACGNPLRPPKLVTDAKYTGKPWAGFQPTTLIVVVPAPQPVTEIILVNIQTGDWFSRLTGRIEIVDRRVDAPRGPLTPGIPAPTAMKPGTPTASGSTSASGSSTSSSGSTSSGATTSGSTTSGSTTSGSTTSGSTTSGSTTSGSTTSGSTTSGSTSSGATTSSGGPSSTTASPTTRSATTGTTTSGSVTTTSAATTTAHTPTATCATTAPSTLPPCTTTTAAIP
ncbi:DUF6777 domain-containing protein [Streptomyces sp. NRRL WC-3742]|uniref:DUF6777 domain-containing protein n=1 Tax=Streptomyces sp. NRRL WC-3742 TaxID=1463934 RepID=UPI00131ABA60|nr:DUF6777 domain-containing protein [Streptomyces sp. NRRL WC-3742]